MLFDRKLTTHSVDRLSDVAPNGVPDLLVFVGNPTQYHAPIFRALSKKLKGKMQVLFGDEIGARPFFNPEVNAVIDWDVPVLDGYPHAFFRNRARAGQKGFWSRNNPSIFAFVLRSKARFVLIHGYDTMSSWYVFVAAKLSGKTIFWRGETIAKPRSTKRLADWAKRLVLPLYFRGVHRVLWSCQNNRDTLERYLPVGAHKLIRFPCAVDNAYFRARRLDPGARKGLRDALGIPQDHMVVATCSRLTARKRTDILVEAVAKLPPDRVTLLIIGDGPKRAALEAQVAMLGVNAHFAGFVGQGAVAELLSIADVFALLSRYDASPKALNEAMNFPLPLVVSTGVGTARDLVRPGENGHLFGTESSDDLANWLEQWCTDPDLRLKMGAQNDSILADFTIQEGVDALVREICDD